MTQRPPGWSVRSVPDSGRAVSLEGCWSLAMLLPASGRSSDAPLMADLARLATDPALGWDLRGIERLDDAGAALLWQAWGRRLPGRVDLQPGQADVFGRLAAVDRAARSATRPGNPGPLVALGRWLAQAVGHGEGLLRLLGRVAIDLVDIVRHPSRIPFKEISANLYRTGSQALGVTALVGFLIGVVLSYLSVQQLHMFGADIYIVNLLGISVIRELGPVLAAILVAGRSGSAMTARIGVMRVTQELDAMSVMGIPHGRRLILPMVVALAIAVPLLCLWTSALALAGGMVAAEMQTGLSHAYFIESLRTAVPIANLWLGLGKGVVFGMLIALVACHFGLRIRPNTESLGQGVTASVVSAITVVIIADAVFAVLFSDVGLVK
jgi:phospholipid/cholesterol/gamma-HCH transport system permease protein